MNKFTRFLIAVPFFASLCMPGDISHAAVSPVTQKSSAETTLPATGFLDFKSLLFSAGTGENLDGIFNQIRIIGPDMFQNNTLRHDILYNYKENPGPVWSASPVWQGDDGDLNVLNVDVFGRPSSASSDLVDAIIGDVTDNTRNHGISWLMNPSVGEETTSYLHSATQRVINLIGNLDNPTLGAMTDVRHHSALPHVIRFSHLFLIFFFGLALIFVGVLGWRRRKASSQRVPKIGPSLCFETIRRSPIRYEPNAE